MLDSGLGTCQYWGMADSTASNSSPRQAFVAIATECDSKGFFACLVTEGEPGYRSMKGNPAKFQTPWYLTVDPSDFPAAERAADEWSARDFGLSPEDCKAIKDSSMIASIRGGN